MSNSLKKAGEKVARTALKVPRAVTAAEAPSIEPAKESTKESMMPWRGWDKMSNFLKEKLGTERYDFIHKFVTFRPGDIHEMNQIPNPSTKIPISRDDPTMTAQFRYPSPGSQKPVNLPKGDVGTPSEDPYNSTYYTRDTGRRGQNAEGFDPDVQEVKLALMDPDSPEVQELKEALQPKSSPGNKGRFATGPTDYDPSGLRAAMSTSHEATEASLDANMPDHLPYPVWYDKQDEIVAWYTERDLPVPFGQAGHDTVPISRRIARW